MAKNGALTTGKKSYIETSTLLQDKGMRSKLQNYIDEILVCHTKILDQKEAIKTLHETAVDELNVDPKMLKSLVSLYHNNSFQQKYDEAERLAFTIELLTAGTPGDVRSTSNRQNRDRALSQLSDD